MVLRSVAALAVVISSFGVGCAVPATEDEGRGETTSQVTGSADERALAAVERKVNNCQRLTAADKETIWRLSPPATFKVDAYVYVSCAVSAGEVVSVRTSLEQRAGWSSSDGAFRETAVSTSTSLNVPIRVVTASGTIAHEETVRTAGGVTIAGSASTVGVGVERNFGLVKASVSADIGLDSASITGGVTTPIEIPMAACGGADGSFGARLSLSVSVDSDIPASIRERASQLIPQDQNNRWVMQTAMAADPTYSAEEREICCRSTGTCDE